MVIASYAPSLLIFRRELLQEFLNLGHEVICCSPNPDPATLEGLASMGISHHAFPLQRAGNNPLADYRTYQNLRQLVAQVQPDHLLAYTIKPVVYGCRAGIKEKVPRVHALITGLGTSFQESGLMNRIQKPIVRYLYKSALRGCNTVFFQNPDDRNLFLEQGLVESTKTRLVAGSGVNPNYFSFSEITPGPPRFLMIARLIEDKGVRVYAEAARLIKRRHPEVTVRLVGFIDDHPGAITQSDLDGWIRAEDLEFSGWADDVRPHFRQCSVYCMPSFREGIPRTVLEAMATGRSIITTDAPGCRETVEDGQNGFLVPPRDPAAFADAMEKFIMEPELASQMGKVSRKMAEEKFDVALVNAAMIKGMGLGA